MIEENETESNELHMENSFIYIHYLSHVDATLFLKHLQCFLIKQT